MAKRKRIGRPPKRPEERRRSHFTFRATDAMREWLRAEAAVKGRSISEEIEYRLEQSRRQDQMAMAVAKAIMDHFEEKEVYKFAVKTIEGGAKSSARYIRERYPAIGPSSSKCAIRKPANANASGIGSRAPSGRLRTSVRGWFRS